MMKASLVAATLVGASLLFGSAREAKAAGHANGFGEKGEFIISAERLVPVFGFTNASASQEGNLNVGQTREVSSSASGISLLWGHDASSYDGGGPSNNFVLPVDVHAVPRVAFDVTIINQLTLGLGVAFAFGLGGNFKSETVTGPNSTNTAKANAPSSFLFGLTPRVGYILPLGEHLALWPRLGMGIYNYNSKLTPLNNDNSSFKLSDTIVSLDLDPNLVIIPTEHWFITVGPMLNIPLAGSRTLTTTVNNNSTDTSQDVSLLHFGIQAGIGGWLNVF